MNCRSEVLELSVEASQVEEAMLAVLHTILLHRSTGKFRYNRDGTYSIGTLGTRDVDCDSVQDLTFVRASCDRLHAVLRRAVSDFRRDWSGDGTGRLSLEFYQKKKGRWPFADECVPWEVWSVKVTLVDSSSSSSPNEKRRRQSGRTNEKRQRQEAGEQLAEKLMDVVQVLNRHRYLPATPTLAQVDQVFDTSLTEVQPYLYRITQHHMTESLGASVSTAVRKLIKDALAL